MHEKGADLGMRAGMWVVWKCVADVMRLGLSGQHSRVEVDAPDAKAGMTAQTC